MARLPRRFRSRLLLLLAILLAAGFFFSAYLAPVPPTEPHPSSWWNLIWTEPQNAECGTWKGEGVLDTGELYPRLDFSVPDNGGIGLWNEVLESRYREIKKTWKDLPLKVIVVPHSHLDPGWLRTYEEYYTTTVSHILDNMVTFLNKTEEFRFIWAETSFFSTWWNKQNHQTRDTVKKILSRKQLEFVTGGWVMPDEATTSYFGIIDQLVEGQQWLKRHLDTKPSHAWSIDVFGHSASVPYILSSAGMMETVILRTHYAWKQYFAKMQYFDFYWEYPFNSPRILSHMAPSDLYSFKHTCGPDHFVCLKYDFRQVGGEYSESTADMITEKNVELKAGYLLSQYGRYASLLPHNVLLVPLGDDFRYNLYIEWVQQFENYQKLFKYINNKKEWNTHIRFGTVADYFEEVQKRLQNNITLPSIQGDFLPYGDIYANNQPSYWTGFYTTRPFYKKLVRQLEHWLRTSEILYSLAKTLVPNSARSMMSKDYLSLSSARQNLGLFQHHDAITGTSKQHVMVDYGKRLHASISDAMSVTSHITQLLLMKEVPVGRTWTSQVYPDVYIPAWNQPFKKLSIVIPEDGRKIIIFNPLTVERTEVLRLKVRSSQVKVIDSNQKELPFQINPVWKEDFVMSNSVFELLFAATLKPLSYSAFTIFKNAENDINEKAKATLSLFLKDDTVASMKNSAFKFDKTNDKDIYFESRKIRAKFSRSGLLKEIYLKESGVSRSFNIDFKAYIPKEYRSGAYLFYPESSDPIPLRNLTDHFPLLYVIRGPLQSELNMIYHNFFKFSIRLFSYENAPQGLQMEVSCDISKITRDVELIMKIKSAVQNKGIFYTDSNSFQILRRKRVARLPVQANYYPVTSSMYIEDETFRLNLLSFHSHGGTSTSGEMEVMIDRRMRYDDGRGMGEGIEDNQMVSSLFWLLPESVDSWSFNSSYLTSKAHVLSLSLQYPPVILVTENADAQLIKSKLTFLANSWPSGVHLVNLRTLSVPENYDLPSNDSLMIVHESQDTCRLNSFIDEIVKDVKSASFSEVQVKSVVEVSLTGISLLSEGNITKQISSKLQSAKITFR